MALFGGGEGGEGGDGGCGGREEEKSECVREGERVSGQRVIQTHGVRFVFEIQRRVGKVGDDGRPKACRNVWG